MTKEVPDWLAEEVFYATDHLESALGDAMLEGTETFQELKKLMGNKLEKVFNDNSKCPVCHKSTMKLELHCTCCNATFKLDELEKKLNQKQSQ